ncbi:YlxR family protein [Metallumcola ferriviriculae]|uniref:YlxR family protein n=2 Tax=Metallumcola ferriviriculae TaxID=3039180 RepID=A0AAU0UNR9_9FIRM|nr:YlxR family protein [Desulfitibacteraceae bacterium MK1]
MCLGCRERKDKRELVRVVRSPEGEIHIDPSGKRPGRGAYVCPDKACLAKAIKTKALERSLAGAISEEVRQKLLEEVLG